MAGAVDNSYSYVYTNPSQNRKSKLIVTQKDRVFVLGKNIPNELIIDYSIKQTKKADPMNKEQHSGTGGADSASNPLAGKNNNFYGIRQINDDMMTARNNKSATPINLAVSPDIQLREGQYKFAESDLGNQIDAEGGSNDPNANLQVTSERKVHFNNNLGPGE